jgi:hypothetical protein
MLASAQEKDHIPIECFAKKGSNCINVVMTKIMFCDESHTHHHPTCIGGNNFGNCYDRITHPPASIALQSFGVPRSAIRVLLLAMQMMRFFLQIGYGESDRSYGDSTEDRTLGLGQGNATAGPGFLAISAQIVNAYLQDGHGARTMASLSHRCFILAAVLYVDNTDNIHMMALMSATPKELIDHAQLSRNAWGGLGIATSTAMKPDKCFAYFLVYNFSNSRSLMGSIGSHTAPATSILQLEGPSLPSHMTVPLPDGTAAPIPTLPPTTASLMLGIWFRLASQGTKHIAKMCQKGINWTDHLYFRPLSHSKAWTSFSLQLLPGMSRGISTVVLSPPELYLAKKTVYYRCLPLLGVQRHIELPWQTLPEAYQGIRIPNFTLLLLASKLQLMGPRGASNCYIFQQAPRGALLRSDLAWCRQTRRYLFLRHFYRCEKA